MTTTVTPTNRTNKQAVTSFDWKDATLREHQEPEEMAMLASTGHNGGATMLMAASAMNGRETPRNDAIAPELADQL